jgi:hypothetical protein
MELLSCLHQGDVCGPQNGATFKQLNDSGILVELDRDTMTTPMLHFSTTTAPIHVEEEVRMTTAIYKNFLQRSGNLEDIFDEESPLKLTAIITPG